MKKPQRKLGLFHLCGETAAERPIGSTEPAQLVGNAGIKRLKESKRRSTQSVPASGAKLRILALFGTNLRKIHS